MMFTLVEIIFLLIKPSHWPFFLLIPPIPLQVIPLIRHPPWFFSPLVPPPPLLLLEVSTIILWRSAGLQIWRSPHRNGLMQTPVAPHSCSAFSFSLRPYHLSLPPSPPPAPPLSSLHLPDSRSSSAACCRSHLFSLDMAFYLRSNSHHFNRDKITLRRAPVPAGLPACVCVSVCVCLWLWQGVSTCMLAHMCSF